MDGNVPFHHTKSFIALLKAVLYTEKDLLPFNIVIFVCLFYCYFVFFLCKKQAAGTVPISVHLGTQEFSIAVITGQRTDLIQLFLITDLFWDHCQSLTVLRINCTLVLIFTDRLFPGASRWPKERYGSCRERVDFQRKEHPRLKGSAYQQRPGDGFPLMVRRNMMFFFLEHVKICRFSSEYQNRSLDRRMDSAVKFRWASNWQYQVPSLL